MQEIEKQHCILGNVTESRLLISLAWKTLASINGKLMKRSQCTDERKLHAPGRADNLILWSRTELLRNNHKSHSQDCQKHETLKLVGVTSQNSRSSCGFVCLPPFFSAYASLSQPGNPKGNDHKKH